MVNSTKGAYLKYIAALILGGAAPLANCGAKSKRRPD